MPPLRVTATSFGVEQGKRGLTRPWSSKAPAHSSWYSSGSMGSSSSDSGSGVVAASSCSFSRCRLSSRPRSSCRPRARGEPGSRPQSGAGPRHLSSQAFSLQPPQLPLPSQRTQTSRLPALPALTSTASTPLTENPGNWAPSKSGETNLPMLESTCKIPGKREKGLDERCYCWDTASCGQSSEERLHITPTAKIQPGLGWNSCM